MCVCVCVFVSQCVCSARMQSRTRISEAHQTANEAYTHTHRTLCLLFLIYLSDNVVTEEDLKVATEASFYLVPRLVGIKEHLAKGVDALKLSNVSIEVRVFQHNARTHTRTNVMHLQTHTRTYTYKRTCTCKYSHTQQLAKTYVMQVLENTLRSFLEVLADAQDTKVREYSRLYAFVTHTHTHTHTDSVNVQ